MTSVFAFFLSAVAIVTSASVEFPGFDASSKAGRDLILSSRQLEDNFDASFVAQHSIIFDGCHNTTTWTEDGLQLVPLVRYRLCPTKYVHSNVCWSKKVGEYLAQMNTFVDAYMEFQLEIRRQNCEALREMCNCDGYDDDCSYHCYYTYSGLSWSDCADEQGEEERFGECQKLEFHDNGRRLNDGGNQVYMGPYCGTGGKGVYLTLFTDEACAMPMSNANGYYMYLSGGVSMQYQEGSGSGMIKGGKWLSCAENEGDNNNSNDKDDGDGVNEMCEEAYQGAAKCEKNMTSLTYPDTSACGYISYLKSSGNVAYQMTNHYTASSALFVVVGALIAGAAMYAFVSIRSKNKKASTKTVPLVEVELA